MVHLFMLALHLRGPVRLYVYPCCGAGQWAASWFWTA